LANLHNLTELIVTYLFCSSFKYHTRHIQLFYSHRLDHAVLASSAS